MAGVHGGDWGVTPPFKSSAELREIVSDIAAALQSRIRNPFLGYLTLSAILINWKVIGVLLFADELSLLDRYDYFDSNTSVHSLLIIPLSVAVAASLVLPWVSFAAAYVARKPIREHRFMVEEEASKRQIHKLRITSRHIAAESELEEAREKAKISRASRLSEVESIGDEQIRNELRQDILEERDGSKPEMEVTQRAILILLSRSQHGSIIFVETDDSYSILLDGTRTQSVDRKTYLKIRDDVNELFSRGLVSISGDDAYAITSNGYEVAAEKPYIVGSRERLPKIISDWLEESSAIR